MYHRYLLKLSHKRTIFTTGDTTSQSSERAVICPRSLREYQCYDSNPGLTPSCSVLGTEQEEGPGPQEGGGGYKKGPKHW